jgi:hypothetical protein
VQRLGHVDGLVVEMTGSGNAVSVRIKDQRVEVDEAK